MGGGGVLQLGLRGFTPGSESVLDGGLFAAASRARLGPEVGTAANSEWRF